MERNKRNNMIVKCPKCGTEHTIQKIDPNSTYYCTKCNSIIVSGGKLQIASGDSAQVELKTKYDALRIISTFLQILAYIVGAVGIILSIFGSSLFPVVGAFTICDYWDIHFGNCFHNSISTS
jgi:hypothetical protein